MDPFSVMADFILRLVKIRLGNLNGTKELNIQELNLATGACLLTLHTELQFALKRMGGGGGFSWEFLMTEPLR